MNRPQNPKYHRQYYILAMVDLAGGNLSKMDFQKLLFLSQHETTASYYDFVPYYYGCYSFQANADVDRLQSLGWLDVEEKSIRMKHSLHWDTLTGSNGKELWRFMTRYKNIRGSDLVRSVYERYPYYAINSRIADKIAATDTKEEIAKIKASTQAVDKTLFTIGYEELSFEAYTNKLLQNGIKLLCDVRKNPLSRKFGFSKKILSHTLPKLGINYIHIPELGIVSEKRKDLASASDYKVLFDNYRASLGAKSKHLSEIIRLLDQHKRVALTCFEKHSQFCHRHCISNYLEIDGGIRVTHL